MSDSQANNSRLLSGALIVFLVLLIGGVAAYARRSSNNSTQETTETPAVSTATSQSSSSPVTSTPATSSASPVSSMYKDGVYSSEGQYTSPGGLESIKVSLTIANDIVTAATVESNATNPQSKEYQANFIANYKGAVVGKPLSDLQVSKVSRSSLTPKGFNDAVESIKEQAQS